MLTLRLAGPVLAIAAVLSVGASCDDSATMPVADGGLRHSEAGLPFHVTEAGLVFHTEAGAVRSTEAGALPVDAGPLVDAPSPDGWYSATCSPYTCLGRTLACGDCQDNDGDGKIDSQDPECLGPCDNTEGPVLLPGVGGEIGSTCHVDCYFDDGNGMGQDSCWWDHQCDPLEPELSCSYRQQLVGGKFCPAQQAASCMSYCVPLTPNGCDCFGCCTFPQLAGLGAGGAEAFVWIGATDASNSGTCTFAAILDPTKCPRCTPVPGCYKPCGKCQLCIGKTTLPPECYTAPPPPPLTDAGTSPDGGTSSSADAGVPPLLQCPGGQQPCGLPGQAACPAAYYCISGCCIDADID